MKNLEEVLAVATATVLHYTIKVHIAHFNITGPRFYELHKLLQLIYKSKLKISAIDSVKNIAFKIKALFKMEMSYIFFFEKSFDK